MTAAFEYDPDTVVCAGALVMMVWHADEESRYADPDVLWAVTRALASFDPRVIVMALLCIIDGLFRSADGTPAVGYEWAQRELAATREGLT